MCDDEILSTMPAALETLEVVTAGGGSRQRAWVTQQARVRQLEMRRDVAKGHKSVAVLRGRIQRQEHADVSRIRACVSQPL